MLNFNLLKTLLYVCVPIGVYYSIIKGSKNVCANIIHKNLIYDRKT